MTLNHNWEHGKVIEYRGLRARCVHLSEVPRENGILKIPAVRAGWTDDGPPHIAAYYPHLIKTEKDYYRADVYSRREGEIRVFVLEDNWQKVNPSENEFGEVSP